MTDPPNLQVPENQRSLTCDSLRKSVTLSLATWDSESVSLYTANTARKYLDQHERDRALKAMAQLTTNYSMFAQVLAWTGARISEVLALTAQSFQVESSRITIVTLKRREFFVRTVPIPPKLMASLDRVFGLRKLQLDEAMACRPVWPFCRMTAWRIVKRVMAIARIAGPQACPKGFRHAFAICCLHAGVPITLVQKWMGHARLSTTAIYLSVCGPEEVAFARRFWNASRYPRGIPSIAPLSLSPCA